MGVAERGRFMYKDVFPFAGMMMIEFMLVGGNTLYKSASVQGINSYVFTFYVFLIGFIFLLPCIFVLHRRTSVPPIKISIAGKIFILSVIMYLSQICGYVGLKYGNPTLSSIMSNLSPAFTFVLAFFFRMEKVHLRSYTSQAKIIGTLLSISGAIIATAYSGPLLLSTSMNTDWIIGGILLASQYFLLSCALVAQAKILVEYSVDLIVVLVFSISGLFVAGLGALIMARDLESWKLRLDVVLATILYMGFSSGFFNVVVQIWVLRMKGPVYVAMFKPLTIIIAVIMGVLILGDSLHLGRQERPTSKGQVSQYSCRQCSFAIPLAIPLTSDMKGSKEWKKIIGAVLMVTAWEIWKARNETTFNNHHIHFNRTAELIKENSYLWITSRSKFCNINWIRWSDFNIRDVIL